MKPEKKEQEQQPLSDKNQSRGGFVFDLCFVLVICFVIIMISIKVSAVIPIEMGPTATGYHIHPSMLIGSLGAVAALLIFIVKQSSAELRDMLRRMINKEEDFKK